MPKKFRKPNSILTGLKPSENRQKDYFEKKNPKTASDHLENLTAF